VWHIIFRKKRYVIKASKKAVRRTIEKSINKVELYMIDEVMDVGFIYHVLDNEVIGSMSA
jgi:hypothetical protein